MFVQIIEGRTNDAAGIRRQMDRWNAELRPGATGFLGSTAGVVDDGRLIVIARFESEAAARANSDRSEQGQWFTETEKYLEGPATFSESDEVQVFFGGGSDDAGFVQVMKDSDADRAAVARLDEAFEDVGPDAMPQLLGILRAWIGERSTVEVVYFTSEAEARAGEAAGPPEQLVEAMAEFDAARADTDYLDIVDPILH